MKKVFWVSSGPEDDCGHEHRTYSEAKACTERHDLWIKAKVGVDCSSDRKVVKVTQSGNN